jgi:hypothetical protein
MKAVRVPVSPAARTAALVIGASLTLAACGGSSHHTPASSAIVPKQAVKSALPQRAVVHFASDQAVNRPVSSAHVDGKVIAAIPFNPATDGFSFQNYGFIAGTDVGAQAMQDLFGDVVCASGTAASCTLTPVAQQWAAQAAAAEAGGHCYGFSMTALRFFTHNLNPTTFGANTVYALGLSPPLQQTIAADWATQVLTDVQREQLTFTPTQMINQLEQNLASATATRYTLDLTNGVDGSGFEGHAITPIGVSNLGNGQYEILVYDNNYPGTTRVVDIDTSANTWRYTVAVNPNQPAVVWSGQGSTNELGLVPVTSTEHTHPCPFCSATSAGAPETVALGGNPVAHAHLLITTGDGRKLGYVRGRLVNQIKGARIIRPELNAIWQTSAEPVYQLPAGEKLAVTLSGGDPTGQDPAQIIVTGPGYGATVADLKPISGSVTQVTVQPSGATLAVRQTGTKATPTLQLAHGKGRSGDLVEVSPRALATGNQLSVALPASGSGIHVSTSDARTPVALSIHAVGPQGTKTKTTNVAVPAGQSTTVSTGLISLG